LNRNLPISAFQVARTIDMSHWHLAEVQVY
jgi:hypothetical protein